MTWMIVLVLSILLMFITRDLVRSKKGSSAVVQKTPFTFYIESETKKVIEIDAEVARKLEELRSHVGIEEAAAPAVQDPNSDTRCMKAIREKVEKVEQLRHLPPRRNLNG